MPSSAPQIPAAAVRASAKAMFVEVTGRLADDARAGLEAAYPHLLAVWTEQVLSDEALTAGVEARGESPSPYQLDVQRESIEAALASIDSPLPNTTKEGTDGC